MSRTVAALTLTLAAVARAGDSGLTTGNILLNDFNWPAPAIGEYTPAGDLVTSCFAIQLPLGCSITPQERLVTTVRGPDIGVYIFNTDGTEAFYFETPQVFTPGDVSVFSDGTIAVCDQNSNWIETYSVDVDNQTAVYTGPIAAPGGNTFFGSFVDEDDNLWGATSFHSNSILQFSRAGEVIRQIVLTQEREPKDVIVDRADGSIWVTVDWDDPTRPEEILHLSSTGQSMGGFTSGPFALGDIRGIGKSPTGELYVTWNNLDEIRVFTQTGTPLGPIPIVDPQVPVFLTVVPPLPGDWDGDGDVDVADFTVFRQCARGPGASTSNPCKVAFDFDSDADVDLHDWWVFQQAFTGEIGSQAGSDEATEPRSDEGTGGGSDEGTQPRRGIKRKPATLIPPAYPEVILDVEVDPDSPEVVIPRR